jgi:micrococcal nuclease
MRPAIVRGFITILAFLACVTYAKANDTAIVLRVVDGDTLVIAYEGRQENIRLIGIDTPESRINPKAIKDAARSNHDIAVITAMGKEATRYVRALITEGTVISIEFDVQKRDKYRRLLGYAYLPDGKMLNEEIVKAGYAGIMTYPPNVKYQEKFLKAYREAFDAQRGLYRTN